ncbi:YidH family protein [Priestia koreensis]|uniref:YidH family protein n=1 Tax=Priestia koreensis TaxID=284581 RepID=UPI001F5990BB|nr:DUF202 domain-containing protein [Priestia koreensis]MCM3006296.1 DUF202 domain-containing protein [Priestia koreensis]UNL82927.1 DUF202 domain-containing protein [Priestia koreensis]
MEKEQTVDSTYIQQHLASERTYLAWIRTAIAIVGVGFLVTNLHFNKLSEMSTWADTVVTTIGFLSVALGVLTIIVSTVSYMRKRGQINTQTFKASYGNVIFLSVSLLVIFVAFFVYLLKVMTHM